MSQDELSGPDLDGVVADANAVGLPPLDYDTVAERALRVELGDQQAPVADLRSIVGFKRLANRPRDQYGLKELEAFHGALPIEHITGLDT